MEFRFTGKIAKDGRYLTYSDDIRLTRGSNNGSKWEIVGFAHNPEGPDRQEVKMIQHGDHYGKKDGETVAAVIITTPQFRSRASWDTLDDARRDIIEGVPLNKKWGFDAAAFGQHLPITFSFLGHEGLGECILYDLRLKDYSW